MSIDKDILQFINDMEIDDIQSIASLYQDYIFECNEIINEIEANIGTLNTLDFEKMIHNIKGVSSNLYIRPMYDITQSLDNYLKDYINEPQLNKDILNMWIMTLEIYHEATKAIVSYFKSKGQIISLK